MDNKPEFLYKYRNFEDPYMENIIKHSSLYFSKVEKFNDPFDINFDLKQSFSNNQRFNRVKQLAKIHKIDYDEYKLMKKKSRDHAFFLDNEINSLKTSLDKISILSLSSDPKNILMWSHYSYNHTGLVFEFKIKFTNSYFVQSLKVEYEKEYQILNPLKNEAHIKKDIQDLLLTKYSDWEYEQEYRILHVDNNHGEKPFNKLELTSIIFGLKTTDKHIEEIKALCIKHGFDHVKFKKTKKVYGRFELTIEDL